MIYLVLWIIIGLFFSGLLIKNDLDRGIDLKVNVLVGTIVLGTLLGPIWFILYIMDCDTIILKGKRK